jgi:hypothetical protein
MRPNLPITILLILLYAIPSNAQDANYWSTNYGPGGFFTPGAVIANNKDSGVFFYNPALLAYTNKNSTSITGNIYQYESIKISNAVGSGLGLSSTGGSIDPEMLAGSIAIHGKRPFVIGYGLIRNPISTFQATQRKDARLDVLNDSYSPGPEYFVGQYAAQNEITETSAILSAGMKLLPGLSAGLSMEGQLRRQNYNINVSSRALYNSSSDTLFPPIASFTETYLATYTHIGLRFKGGLSYEAGTHHLGLLISAPMVHLLGSGTLYADNEVNDLIISGYPVNLLANTRQTGLNARWKEPLSVALGYAYDYSPEGQIYIAAEFFNKIGDYNVVTPRNAYFIRPDTGNNNSTTADLLKLRDMHKSIVNFGIGISFALRPQVTGYVSFRSDLTYAVQNTEAEGFPCNTSDWNNWNMQAGANIKKRKFNFRPGLLLSYGRTSKYAQPVNFDDPNENNLLLGDTHTVKATHFSAGLMLAYIHNL